MNYAALTAIMALMISGCEGPSVLELEQTILACNAGMEKDLTKCRSAEKAQAENIKSHVNEIFKR